MQGKRKLSLFKEGNHFMNIYTGACNFKTNSCGNGGCGRPEGPSVGSIIPYSNAYLYLEDHPEFEHFINNEWFVMPRDGMLERLILSFEMNYAYAVSGETGIIGYRVYTAPINSRVPLLVASGEFVPQINEFTAPGMFFTVDRVLNVPVRATTRVAIALVYTVSGSEAYSYVEGSVFGGLNITGC